MKPRKLALLTAAASFALTAPAYAQMDHSKMPGMKMPAPKKAATKKPTAKKPTAKKPTAAKKAPAKKRPAKKAAPAEQQQMPGHEMSDMPQRKQQLQPMPPGHDMSQMPGMQMPASTETEAAGTNLPAGNAPRPPAPTDHAADAVYGPQAMEMGRHHLRQFHGGQKLFQALFNIAEIQFHEGREAFGWDSEAWYGGDINRLWVKSEGEGEFGRSVEKAEVQALYSRAVDPYFNIQGGIRYDFKPNPSRVYATFGFEGLAPSFFDVEGALFLSNKGELMARASGWYDQRITQRLILQPRAEVSFAAQRTREIGVGSGLSDAEIGLRLRYDIRREFAPYVGVQYRRAFGDTRRFLREEGEDAESWSLVTGIRVWF